MDVTRSLGSARRDGVMDRLNDDSRIRGARLSACRADLSPVLDRFGHVPLLLAAAACLLSRVEHSAGPARLRPEDRHGRRSGH